MTLARRDSSWAKGAWAKGLPTLAAIWLVTAVCDRLWIWLDHAPPSWDAADYLAEGMVYWKALQTPQWFSGAWWTHLWLLSPKIPPLVYLSTVPITSLFGGGADQGILVFLGYSAVLLGSVYLLGLYLFNLQVGLWAACLCVLMPTLYKARLEFLLDYPLAAMVALSFVCLTLWHRESLQADSESIVKKKPEVTETQKESILERFWNVQSWYTLKPWILAGLAGITFGLALLTKQPAALFLFVPIVWVLGEALWQRTWRRVAQLGILFLASLPIWFPWYRTNWLLILTSSKRATIDSAAIQGSPSLLTLDAWTFYLRFLPKMVTPPLLVVPLLGLLLFWRRSRVSSQWAGQIDYDPKPLAYRQQAYLASQQALLWLAIFLVGGYFLSTLNPNKDLRYMAPFLPVLAVVLAYGFTLLPRSWRVLHWGTIALAGLLMVTTLFPIFTVQSVSDPTHQFFPYRKSEYPHREIVTEVRKVEPYLRSTIGVLPSTPQVNQYNIHYYGLLQNFQVYGRMVGERKAFLAKDRRSISWFLTQSQESSGQGSQEKVAISQAVEQGGEFRLQKSWNLPDSRLLKLYRRRLPPIEVKPLKTDVQTSDRSSASSPIQLEEVTVPAQVPPGQPIPVTYRWSGSWKNLQSGLVLLTWRQQGDSTAKGSKKWLHDHGVGLGTLYPEQLPQERTTSTFQVIERLAMFPPQDAVPGTYTLQATYLDRRTGQATPLPVPPTSLQIEPTAPATAAPELDFVTQLHLLADTLPRGVQSLSRISNEISRIHQYDPVQDYLWQARQAMEYRLEQEPRNRRYAYTLALAAVLQRQVKPAIAAWQRVTELDPKNPYAYAYLAFVNLYDFRPFAAQQALNEALKLKPEAPAIRGLNGIAALMQGNIVQAWSEFQQYQKLGGIRI